MSGFSIPSMEAIAVHIVTPLGVQVFSGLIVLGALIAYLLFRSKIRPLTRQLSLHLEDLRRTEGEEGFAEHLPELSERFERSSLIAHCWSEFKETLIEPDIEDLQDLEDKDKVPVVRCPFSSADFFDREALLAQRLNLRQYNAIPNYLTGAGILGTFIGLVAGIHLAGAGLGSTDATQMNAALEGLLNGASLAFITSIVGLSTSIVFSSREKRWVHRFDILRGQWVEALDERLRRVTPETIALDTLRESRQQTLALQQFSNELAFQLVDALEKSVVTPMQPILEKVVESLEGIRSDQSSASDETLERLIREFSQSISGSAGKEMDSFASAVSSMSETLETQISNLTSSQAAMQKSTESTIESLTDSFRENSRQLNAELSTSVQGMVAQIGGAVRSMTSALADSTATTTTNMQEIVASFGGSISKLQESIRSIEDVSVSTANVMTQVEGLLGTLRSTAEQLKATGDPIRSAANELSQTASSMHQVSQAVMNSTGALGDIVDNVAEIQQQLEKAWGDYTSRFGEVDESLRRVFEELDEGLQQFAARSHDFMTSLDEHAARVVDKLAGAVEQLDGSIEDLAEQVEAMGRRNG